MRLALLALLLVLSAPVGAEVYRCGNAYSSTPCAGGKLVNTSPATSVGSEGATTMIYLCKGYSGQRFWTSKHCAVRGDSTLDREVRVPSDMRWEDKVKYAAGERRAAEALRSQSTRAQAVVAPHQPDPTVVCDGLRQALVQNDQAARTGGTARWMEHLAQERRDLIKQQGAAGCR